MLKGAGSIDKLVSVIMPVYNASAFLREAIDSICSQTYSNVEILIINDGSTDDSDKIILSYKDERIKYYKQENKGVASALNTGVEKAKGDYLWRHDADDISLPEKLEKQVKFLETNPGIALCACQVAFMTERGKVAWDYRQPKNNYFKELDFVQVHREQFDPYSPITHGTVLVRTGVVRELKGYREKFITGEDIDLWLRLIEKNKAVVLNDCLSLHRLNKTSATQKHGWKNEFFRNLAFKYYDQRSGGLEDDLEKGLTPIVTDPPVKALPIGGNGKVFRSDLLLFLYPLHLNAKDGKGSWSLVRLALRDGWKLSKTWKAVFFPLLGKKIVKAGVRVKSFFRK